MCNLKFVKIWIAAAEVANQNIAFNFIVSSYGLTIFVSRYLYKMLVFYVVSLSKENIFAAAIVSATTAYSIHNAILIYSQ